MAGHWYSLLKPQNLAHVHARICKRTTVQCEALPCSGCGISEKVTVIKVAFAWRARPLEMPRSS